MLPKTVLAAVFASGLAASAIGATACTGSAATTANKDIVLPKEYESSEGVVPNNATFDTLFRKENLDDATSQAVIASIATAFSPRGLKASQAYRIVRTLD